MIVATTGTLTRTTVLPVFPSMLAVIVACPSVTPVTTPSVLTRATASLLLDQVICFPDMTWPDPVLAVALSCSVRPVRTLSAAAVTSTDAINDTTRTASESLLPSLVARIMTLPVARARTKPMESTVATASLLLVHTICFPVSVCPSLPLVVAVRRTVSAMARLSREALIVTAATAGTLTRTGDVPILPSALAVIVTFPSLTPVTIPFASTRATASLLLAHVNVFPETIWPDALLAVALS